MNNIWCYEVSGVNSRSSVLFSLYHKSFLFFLFEPYGILRTVWTTLQNLHRCIFNLFFLILKIKLLTLVVLVSTELEALSIIVVSVATEEEARMLLRILRSDRF